MPNSMVLDFGENVLRKTESCELDVVFQNRIFFGGVAMVVEGKDPRFDQIILARFMSVLPT